MVRRERQEQPVSDEELEEMPEKIEEAFDEIRDELPSEDDE
jgi:molybdopterin synthase catalytic subunit